MNDGRSLTAICVLGPSRSGTSLTARVLGLAGVHLGRPEDLLGGDLAHIPAEDRDKARAANPEGFWEHYGMMRLNERILSRFGGSWREPPHLPPGWEGSPELDSERADARTLIEESFAGHPVWGWKDPRNSLTLPFWRTLLPRLRCAICLRNPIDAAASLARRDGIDRDRALALWQTYVAAALTNTVGLPRLLIPYEDYFSDPDTTVGRLARLAGLAEELDDRRLAQRLAAPIDERLWRNRAGSDGTA